MHDTFRAALLTLTICGLSSSTAAVEVHLRLGGQLQPPGSVIDIDAAGVMIRGAINFVGDPENGIPSGSWTCVVEFVGSASVYFPGSLKDRQYPVLDPARIQYGSRHADPACPVPLPWFWWQPIQDGQVIAEWTMRLTRVASQSDFSGELALRLLAFDSGGFSDVGALTFAFDSVPESGSPPCSGDVLLLDTDGDGETDARDLRSGFVDGSAGPGVDENGVTVADFCWGVAQRARATCRVLDFRNDEPQLRKPRDCAFVSDGEGGYCDAAEYFGGAGGPFAAPRTCLGYALFDDADGDGEPDTSDRCPSTPHGAAIDGNGCSAAQFCSVQSAQDCRRADFRNDEPFVKKPADCLRSQATPSACAAAALN